MIGFLKNRARKNAAAKADAKASADKSSQSTEPTPPAGSEPAAEGGAEAGTAETAESTHGAETAAPTAPEVPERYEAREDEDGWSVHDRQTGTTAETYGYRLTRMNRARAESLVEVLNRGEARRRGRNG
jgi:hypothetical protein